MPELVQALDEADVPLFAITNFSGEFWPPFRTREAAMFDRFRDVVVSGAERLMKPDPAIFALAMARFGLGAGEALFVDDRPENVRTAEDAGLIGHVFVDAPTLRTELRRQGLL
jgi:2-haloacid dehalogenase